MSIISAEQDLIQLATPSVNADVTRMSALGQDFLVNRAQLLRDVGSNATSFHLPSSGTTNAITSSGANLQWNIEPSSVVPDYIDEIFLEITLTHQGATGTLTLDSYAAMLMNNVLFRYGSGINNTHFPNTFILNSLYQYNVEEFAVRGAQENINTTTYAPASTVLAVGGSVTFRIPMDLLFCGRRAWIRSLFSQLEFTIAFNTLASVVTAAGGAVVGDLGSSQVQLWMVGYKYAENEGNRIMDLYKDGSVHLRRYIFPQSLPSSIPGGIVSGSQYTVNIGNNNSLVIGLTYWVTSSAITPQNALTAVANSATQVTLQNGSQSFTPMAQNISTTFFRTVLVSPPSINSPAINALSLNPYPFSNRNIYGICLRKALNTGSYYTTNSTSLQLLSAVTNASVQLACIYHRVCCLVQQGTNCAIKLF